MNYSDYFETAVAAELNNEIFVTTCNSKNEIIDARSMASWELDKVLDIADYYKVELAGDKATIYVHP